MKNAPTTTGSRGIATQQRNVITLEQPLQHFAPTLWGSTTFSLNALTGAQNRLNDTVLDVAGGYHAH